MHKIDNNELIKAKAKAKKLSTSLIGATPCPIDPKTGKINPQATRFHLADGKYMTITHVKPIYYETLDGHWRPLSEVTSHHGNHYITLDKWWAVNPRYINWLDKRCKLIGGELKIPTHIPSPMRESLQYAMAGHIGLTSTTVYPDPHTETTTVDGQQSWDVNNGGSWDSAQSASSANYGNDNSTQSNMCYALSHDNPYQWIYRAFFLFDTSSIGDTDTVDSATMDVWIVTSGVMQTTPQSSQQYIVMNSVNPASNTALNTGGSDFGSVGFTAYSDEVNPSNGAFSTWTLNASGESALDFTGVSKFGLLCGFDMEDIEPGPTGYSGYGISAGRWADYSGTTYDPYLTVVHTAGGGGGTTYNALIMCNF